VCENIDEHAIPDRVVIEVNHISKTADKTPAGFHFPIEVEERGIPPYAENSIFHTIDERTAKPGPCFEIFRRLVKVGGKEWVEFNPG
jgi:hypothetical protein